MKSFFNHGKCPRSSLFPFILFLQLIIAAQLNFNPAALAADERSAAFYNPKVVQTIHLDISPENLKKMQNALPERKKVMGTFRWNDVKIEQVGIRYKGDSSSHPLARHKRSFLISFDEYRDDQSFLGLTQASLDNAVQFGSLFSERLITDILRENGLPASRCNYARLMLNGKFHGVYVNVERLNRPFLLRSFGDDGGVLLKVDHGGPGADFRLPGDDPSVLQKTFDVQNGSKSAAYSNLLKFLDQLNNPALSEEELRKVIDLDAFIKTTAVMLFSGAFDQYTGWHPHNYFLYQRADGRWTYIPWDLDVGFADKAFGKIPVLEGWHAAWPAPMPGRPLLEHIVSKSNLLDQYRAEAEIILEKNFKPDILIPRLRELYSQIQDNLKADPFPPQRITVPSDKNYQDILASMEQFVRTRYQSAKTQLSAPGERPPFSRAGPIAGDRGPAPGDPSADAPSDLRAVRVTPKRVDLAWKDHASGEVAFVVQKAAGEPSAEFRNAIGQGGADLSSAVDQEVEPGKTYRYRVYAVLPTPEGPRGTGVSNEITVAIPSE